MPGLNHQIDIAATKFPPIEPFLFRNGLSFCQLGLEMQQSSMRGNHEQLHHIHYNFNVLSAM